MAGRDVLRGGRIRRSPRRRWIHPPPPRHRSRRAVRLDAPDPEAGAALRVITYFEDLVAHGAGLPAIVRGAAILTACPTALVDPGQHIRVRIGAGGVAGTPGPRGPEWPGRRSAGTASCGWNAPVNPIRSTPWSWNELRPRSARSGRVP